MSLSIKTIFTRYWFFHIVVYLDLLMFLIFFYYMLSYGSYAGAYWSISFLPVLLLGLYCYISVLSDLYNEKFYNVNKSIILIYAPSFYFRLIVVGEFMTDHSSMLTPLIIFLTFTIFFFWCLYNLVKAIIIKSTKKDIGTLIFLFVISIILGPYLFVVIPLSTGLHPTSALWWRSVLTAISLSAIDLASLYFIQKKMIDHEYLLRQGNSVSDERGRGGLQGPGESGEPTTIQETGWEHPTSPDQGGLIKEKGRGR